MGAEKMTLGEFAKDRHKELAHDADINFMGYKIVHESVQFPGGYSYWIPEKEFNKRYTTI